MQYIKAYSSANGLLTWLQAYYDMSWSSGAWETDIHWAYDLSLTWTVSSQTGKSGNARWGFPNNNNDFLRTTSWPTFWPSQAVSVSLWAYIASTPASYETMFSLWWPSLGNFDLNIRVDNTWKFQLDIAKNQVTWDNVTWWSTFSTSTRYHLVATYDWANNGKLYVNAWTAVTVTYTQTSVTDNTYIMVGGQIYDGWAGTKANPATNIYVDEVWVRTRELSSVDVTALYNSGAWLFYTSFN